MLALLVATPVVAQDNTPSPVVAQDGTPDSEAVQPTATAPAASAAMPAAAPAKQPADPARVRLMGAWLEELSRTRASMRTVNVVGYGVFAAIEAALGVAMLGMPADTSGGRTARNVLAATLFGTSVTSVYLVISNLIPTTDEVRLVEWQASSIDALTLARFEGELAAEAEVAAKLELYARGSMIGIAAAGGLMLAFTPAVDLKPADQTFGYVVGGTLLGIGAVSLVVSLLSEPENVRAYRLYREGKGPKFDDDGNAKVQLTPVLSAREAGLMLTGRF